MGEGLGLGAVDPRAPAAHEFDAYASDAEEREQAIEPSQLALELPTRLLCHRLRPLPLRLLGLDLPQLLLLGLYWAPLRRGFLSLFPMLVDQEAVAAFADRLHPIPRPQSRGRRYTLPPAGHVNHLTQRQKGLGLRMSRSWL